MPTVARKITVDLGKRIADPLLVQISPPTESLEAISSDFLGVILQRKVQELVEIDPTSTGVHAQNPGVVKPHFGIFAGEEIVGRVGGHPGNRHFRKIAGNQFLERGRRHLNRLVDYNPCQRLVIGRCVLADHKFDKIIRVSELFVGKCYSMAESAFRKSLSLAQKVPLDTKYYPTPGC